MQAEQSNQLTFFSVIYDAQSDVTHDFAIDLRYMYLGKTPHTA